MANPKIEFGLFTLDHISKRKKTFRDFAIEVLNVNKEATDSEVLNALFSNILDGISSKPRKFGKSKVAIALFNEQYNAYHSLKPTISSSRHVISGVINGGRYGSEGIVTEQNDDKENRQSFDKDGVIYHYQYIYLYLPPNHDTGFFMSSCNSANESVKKALSQHLRERFHKNQVYNKFKVQPYCPSRFKKEFKNGAKVQSLIFTEQQVLNIPSTNGRHVKDLEFQVKIELVPKDKSMEMQGKAIEEVYETIEKSQWAFPNLRKKFLGKFSNRKATVRTSPSESPKMIEWDLRDAGKDPVAYLKNRVELNPDGTIDFGTLKPYLDKLFNEVIIKDIRPDLNATKR